MKPNLAALSDFGNAPETLGRCTFRGHRGGGADAAWVGDRLMDGNAMTATGVAASVRACLRGGNALAGSAAARRATSARTSARMDGGMCTTARFGWTARAVATRCRPVRSETSRRATATRRQTGGALQLEPAK